MYKRLKYFLSFTLMLIMISTLYGQVDPGTENLSHSWTFNDGTANDYIGGANGTLMGDAEVSFGSLLTALPNSWMEMPADIIAMNTYDEVTIEAWFISVANENTGYHMLAYFGNTINTLGVNGYFITPARGDDKSRAAISCGVEATPWSGESGADGPELDDGELHHMVSTINSAEITLYIDGVLMMTTPLAENNSIEGISSTYAYLGKGGYEADPTWLGDILEFNIFNKALSAEEVLFQFNKGASTTDVNNEGNGWPKKYVLLQNYPNPFNPKTIISYDLPEGNFVLLKVYDMLGNEVAELINEEKSPGSYKIEFDGSKLSSAVYFYKIQAGSFVETRKFVLMK